MPGWGSSSWGSTPWGSGEAAPPVVIATDGTVSAVDVLTSNLILVRFGSDMKNDSRLQNTAYYTITPNGSGRAVIVLSVDTGNATKTSEVLLNISEATVGETYTLTVLGARVANGGFMSSTENSVQFIGRITKADSAIKGTTRVYSTQPGAIYRNIILAITKEDDRIGGNRNDRLPSVDD